jgi:hypothetical protein
MALFLMLDVSAAIKLLDEVAFSAKDEVFNTEYEFFSKELLGLVKKEDVTVQDIQQRIGELETSIEQKKTELASFDDSTYLDEPERKMKLAEIQSGIKELLTRMDTFNKEISCEYKNSILPFTMLKGELEHVEPMNGFLDALERDVQASVRLRNIDCALHAVSSSERGIKAEVVLGTGETLEKVSKRSSAIK